MAHIDPIFRITTNELNDINLPYEMNQRSLGFCVIFNFTEFEPSLKQSPRTGSDVDARRLQRLFSKIGYTCDKIYKNTTTEEMMGICRDISTQQELNAHSSFVCIILSHGEEDTIYTKDGRIYLDSIVKYFKNDRCPSLKGKPKLFFVQACRGRSMDEGVPYMAESAPSGPLISVRKIPVEADILIHQSTVPGYLAWRNEACGSWFIQKLCDVFEKNCQRGLNLLDLLTMVNRHVAYLCYSNPGDTRRDAADMKQMPSIINQLTRRVILPPWRMT